MPPKISICIPCFNEEANLPHALASARACPWCDELLVVDSFSTDRSFAVAQREADRAEQAEWVDYSTSKKRMVERARNDWVLVLDADEEVSPELAAEVAALPDEVFERCAVLTMPRRNHLLGRHVRAWDPDRQHRLFDRRRVDMPWRSLHEVYVPTSGGVGRLGSPLLHNAHSRDFSLYFDAERLARRADMLAREMHQRGKRVGWLGLWLRPWAAFWKFFLLKGGLLQGAFGLLVAQKAQLSTQAKYARLWALQREGPGPGG